MGDGKISQRQLAFLFFTILIGTMFFHNPQIVVGTTGQDGWIAYLIASFWGILVALVMVALGQRFPDQTLTGYIPNILGKPLGKILSLLYTIWFLFIGGGVLAQFANFMNTTIMASTPKMVFIITFVAIAYYAVNLGLETFVRVNELLLWVIVIAIVMVVILPYELMDLRRMLPVGHMGLGKILASSLVAGSWRGEVMMVGMFLPALITLKNTARNMIWTVFLVGVFMIAVQISLVTVFGAHIVGDLEVPVFNLARMISTARVLDRLEALVLIIWVFATFIKICAFLYCTARATADTMGFQEFRFLLLPISLLFTAIAYNQTVDPAKFVDFLLFTWPGYGLLSFELVIPLFLLIVALWRGKREKKV